MTQFRTGLGYDIHRFAENRKLFLGGVEIPFYKGLEGHSDADVVLHAICDALLGAIGLGDIGEHFPNNDPRFKNIASIKLLEDVKQKVATAGFLVGNLDIVVQAEEPKLKDFKAQMKRTIAAALSVEEMVVNIKATTQEGLGAIGHKEGIAAFATVLIYKD